MEWNEQGEVHIGPPDFESGIFGIFTDETPTDNSLEVGVDSEVYVWEGTLSASNIPPYEGENGISWATTGQGWFGAGIMSVQPVNLFNFGDGFLKFMIKIPANVSFKIGVIDTWGNQNYVDFPAGTTTYGLERDGEWGQASIPFNDLRGLYIDLRMLSYEFVILETEGTPCEFSLDDIYSTGGTTSITENIPSPHPAVMLQNYPNPFNPSTEIRFQLSDISSQISDNRDQVVEVEIYNLKGQKIVTLSNPMQSECSEVRQSGSTTYTVTWNGTDSNNTPVSSGVYFINLKSGNRNMAQKKCLLLK